MRYLNRDSFRLAGCGYRPAFAILLAALLCGAVQAQNFTADGLNVDLTNPTSLQFGPDDWLYVSQQNGAIKVFTVERNGAGDYTGTLAETILLVQNIQNHNDDGTESGQNSRQVTGLLVTGTAANPVLYVTSSDPRIAGGGSGNDAGLDTNSGIISRLTWNGSSWDRVDIVRGLPRSEENHSTNGMALDETTNMLFVMQGGHANKGAPSNNFAGTAEYFLSAAMLSVDLNAIAAIESANGGQPFTDPRTGAQYVYDLYTLNDPTRADIDNSDLDFPYPSTHPRFDETIDVGDPFGGNDSLNQAITKVGEPVQIHSPGYRNAYDVVFTEAGLLYTFDNGPNGSWGGLPLIYDSNDVLRGDESDGIVFNEAAGDYCTNEFNEDGSSGHGDVLKFVDAPGYYGGHPAPIRAFPGKARVIDYDFDGSWVPVANHDFITLLPDGFTAADFPGNPIECHYGVTEDDLAIVGSSTNGLTEYTATNFGGAMLGDLLAASFNGNIYRFQLNATGDAVTAQEALFSGFGSTPLDVTAQGDSDVFPGTVWAVTYGSDDLVVFEPDDFLVCAGTNDDTIDEDGDGYTNADEIDNGTDPCSGGSAPRDHDNSDRGDGFKDSDLNDPDDDDDTVLDVDDAFALDAANGTTTALPVNYPFFNGDPGTGLFGLGFTGLMVPKNGTDTWLELFDPNTITAGGTSGLMTVEAVTVGDAHQSGNNSQKNGFLFGVDVDSNSPPFVVHTRLQPPYFDGVEPDNFQSFGMFIGTGDQDHYLKIVLNANGGNGGIEVALEDGPMNFDGTQYANATWGQDILDSGQVDLYLFVDPQASTVQPSMSLDQGTTKFDLGSPILIPFSWLDSNDGQGLAVGLISTANNATEFTAIWDFLNVTGAPVSAPGAWQHIADFNDVRHENAFVQAGNRFYLIGGRESEVVKIYDPTTDTWSDGATAPVKLHHFQAVALDGLIYVVGAMTGTCCSEPPANFVHIYDPEADIWIQGPSIPASRQRGGGGAAAHDGKIYWVSGNTNGHAGPVTAQVDVFDPATGEFTPLADIPNPRDHFFIVINNGKLYAIGGRNSNSGVDDDIFDDTITAVDVYDIAGNTWTTLSAGSNLPTPRAAAATGIIGNEIIVAGGEDASTALNVTEAFDISTQTWRTLTPMLGPRHATQAIVTNNGFYVAGGSPNQGGPGGGASPDLEALYLFGTTSPTGTAINPGALDTLPPSLDFGAVQIGNQATLTLTLDNSGGNQGIVVEDVTLSGTAFTLAEAFAGPRVLAPGNSFTLDVVFSPVSEGTVVDTLTVTHSGGATQAVTLQGEGVNQPTVLYRVNAGGPAVAATDAPNPDWSADTEANSSQYVVLGSCGNCNNTAAFNVGSRHASVPIYAPNSLFEDERWDQTTAPEMQWNFPVADGDYVVRLYLMNGFSGTSQPNEREFDVQIEGTTVLDDYDLSEQYGHQVAVMEEFNVTVSDGNLDIDFLHGPIENPLINAIEIQTFNGGTPNNPPEVTNPGNQSDAEGDSPDLAIAATDGGDGPGNLDFSATGLPPGLDIEPTNGHIFGTINTGAAAGSPYAVEVTVSDGADATSVQFLWFVTTPGASEVLYRINVGGPQVAAGEATSPDWAEDTATIPSTFRVEGGTEFFDLSNANAHDGPINMSHPSVPPGAPAAIFEDERWDQPDSQNPEMNWAFPVAAGTTVELRLFFAEIFSGVNAAGQRVFDVSVEGSVPAAFDDIDQFATAGAAGALMLSTTLTVTDGELNFTFMHDVENPALKAISILEVSGGGGAVPQAQVAITPDGGLTASTFSGDGFQITNTSTGAIQIDSVSINLGTAFLPDMVFDPKGLAGDAAGKCLTPGNGAAATGFVDPGDNCVDPYSQPHNGTNESNGWDVITLNFDDFDPGETFTFSNDVDPTSIKDATGTGSSGSVSGLELTGSTVTVGFSDSSLLTGETFQVPGSLGGSIANVQAGTPAAPTLSVANVTLGPTTLSPDHTAQLVSANSQTIEVQGTPGAGVKLLHVEASLLADNGFDLEIYEANEAVQVVAATATIEGDGDVAIPVTLTRTNNINGGFNYFTAVVDDGTTTGANSNFVILELSSGQPNQPPAAGDDTASVDQGGSVDINLLANDTDADGTLDASSITIVAPPANGSLAEGALGVWTYTHDGSATAADSFTYTVSDNDGAVSNVATVSISVQLPPGGGTPADAQFQQVALPLTDGDAYTTVTIGPDGKLYALDIGGDIHRWSINPNGTLANDEQVITSINDAEANSRLAIGLTFDPAASAGNLIAWVTHVDGTPAGGDNWTGKITRLTGPNMELAQDIVVGLPRSSGDHAVNSMAFGPDGAMYVNVGSLTAMGAFDNSWQDDEELLSAATLRVDLDAIASPPLNVKTADGGSYDPYVSGAPVTVYGAGVRNAYDLVWHSNGELYVPTNGSAPGNTPASSNGDICPDGSAYSGPNVPTLNNVPEQPDLLFRVEPGGYYGHPNPTRCDYVLNGGNPSAGADTLEVTDYPVGTNPDADYQGAAFNFAAFGSAHSHSPNGVIEYTSGHFNGGLQNRLLIVRYHKDDIVALTPSAGGAIVAHHKSIAGLGGLSAPLDLTEDTNNGNIYVSESIAQTITLLRPLGVSQPDIDSDLNELIFSAVKGGTSETLTVTLINQGNAPLTLNSLSLAGADFTDFTIITDPTPVTLNSGGSVDAAVVFTPSSASVGSLSAELQVASDDPDETPFIVSLYGLSADGLEGGNEPPLHNVVTTLGYAIDVGGTSLSLGTGAGAIGDEVLVPLFEKAGVGDRFENVIIEPVARYSPAEVLPFGWYEPNGANPILHQIGELSGSSSPPEHQTLFPEQISGSNAFDPGNATFGFYTTSSSHTAYTEDSLNDAATVQHSVRVYPLKDRDGNLVPNAYLLAFEEASNGDYQDYDFVIRNVQPAGSAPSGCSPISTLPCSQIPVSLPYQLGWSADEDGLDDTSGVGTGFTMVDPPSNGAGYLPANLDVDTTASTLTINTTAGLQYTDSNSQDNGLGVGFDANAQSTRLETTVLNLPAGGGSFEQAGLWFFLDEDNYVKLVALSGDPGVWEVELRAESGGAPGDQILSGNPGVPSSGLTAGDDVQLAMELDPATNQVTAFYSVNGGTEVELGSFALDPTLFTGQTLPDGTTGPVSFAGIFGSHRNAASSLDFAFDGFNLSAVGTGGNTTPSVTNPGNQGNVEGDTVSLAIQASDPDAGDTLTYSAGGLPANLSIDANTGIIGGTIASGAAANSPYAVTVSVSDGTDTTDVSFDWTVVPPGGINAGLLLYWPFDESGGSVAADASGNGHEGALNGDATFVAGQVNNALQLDGLNDFVSDTDSGAYLNGLSAVTVTAWVNADAAGNDEGIFTTVQPDGTDEHLCLRYDVAGAAGGGTNVIKGGVGNSETGDFSVLESSFNVQTTDWQHLALVWQQSGTVQLYIDGQLDTPSDLTGGTLDVALNNVDRLWVGRGSKYNDTEQGWAGLIDEFRIYGRVLSESEIQQLAGIVQPTPQAEVAITPDGGLTASTFSGDGFQITNTSTGAIQIDSVSIDLSTALIPDAVFDPKGLAGDALGKCVDPANDGSDAATGYVDPADACVEPFSQPHNGTDENNGWDVVTLNFTDFDPGETFSFSVDVDPTSIKNATSTGSSGAVSGLELTGTATTVTFSDTTVLSGETFQVPGSQGGSIATLNGAALAEPSLSVSGVTLGATTLSPDHSAATVTTADQTIVVGGPAGVDVKLLHIEAALLADDGFDLEPYEANEAIQVQAYSATIEGDGDVAIPVTLTRTNATDGGYNYFAAVVDDGTTTGPNADFVILELGTGVANQPPVANDDAAPVAQGGSVDIDLLANDTDADGTLDASSIVIVDSPVNGTLTEGVLGVWTYTHDGSATAADSFTYTVSDNDGAVSNSATVSISVQPPPLPNDDVDGDGTPNGTDNDDDNDGFLDTSDPFALDAANGTGTDLPVSLPFVSGAPGTGLYSVGFTGLMTNGTIGGPQGDDYLNLFDPSRVLIDSTGAGTLTVLDVDAGDAHQANNTQTHAFQVGVNVDSTSGPFVVHTRLPAPYFNGQTPQNFQSQGLFIGTGDQDNYLKVVVDGASNDIEVLLEDNGATTGDNHGAGDLLASNFIDLYLVVDPAADTAQPYASVDGGAPVMLGGAVALPDGWLDPLDDFGLAAGLMATSFGAGPVFDASWEVLEVLPLAVDDSFTVAEDSASNSLDVLANDFDDGTTTITAVGTPDQGGSVSHDGDTVTYTPAANFSGTETFTYTILTSLGESATALVTVTVQPSNDAPTGDPQSVTTDEDTAVSITLTGSDPDGDPLTFSVISGPSNGALSGTAPNLTYTPNADFNGSDSFDFKVCDDAATPACDTATVSVTVNAVNDAPTISAIADQTIDEDTSTGALPFTVDDVEDLSGAGLVVTASSDNPALIPDGNLVFGGSGNNRTITATPVADASGVATITVTVSDGEAQTSENFVVTVSAVNDAPSISAIGDQTIDEDTGTGALPFTVGDVETAAGSLSVMASSGNQALVPDANLVLGGSGANRSLTVTPAANQSGTATITITVSDGTEQTPEAFTVTVNAVNDAPVADAQSVTTDEDTAVNITLTGSDVDGDALSFNVVSGPVNGTLSGVGSNRTYTPNANYNGPDTFDFEVSDGNGGTDQATVSITVTAVNDAPGADPQSVTTDEDTAASITLTGSDADGDPLTFSVTAGPSNGALSGTAPNLTYTPNANYNGSDSFDFQVCDNAATPACDSATVSITVNSVNDAPVAGNDSYTAFQDTVLHVPAPGVLNNDTDEESDNLSATLVNSPANGSVNLNGSGGFDYTPNAGYTGPDSFTYTASDHDGDVSNVATVSINVMAPVTITPSPLVHRIPFGGGNETLMMSIDNSQSSIPFDFELWEVNARLPLTPPGPFETAPVRVAFGTEYAERALTWNGQTPPMRYQGPMGAPVGEVASSFATNLAGAWGAAVNMRTTDVWVGNIAVSGGDDADHRFLNNGSATGDSISTVSFVGALAADLAYDTRYDRLWQTNVGADECIHELSMDTFAPTGVVICPNFAVSQRGLAFDPVTDTFYSGSSTNGVVHQFDRAGNLLRSVDVSLPVTGLAYNPASKHLYALVNDDGADDIYVLDTTSPTFEIVSAFAVMDANTRVFGPFSQAGLGIDCEGDLWAVNQDTDTVYQVDTGESGFCSLLDIPWLSLSPDSGVLQAGSVFHVSATFTTQGQDPGLKQGHIDVSHTSPYLVPAIPVELTVGFLDVPPGAFADDFIHALAGAEVTAGCGAGVFCPDSTITRAEMAVWLVVAQYGADFALPPATGVVFEDVAATDFAAAHIEFLFNEGITAGCSTTPRLYCPGDPVTRAQMAVFELKASEGEGYTPPACTGVFDDVPCSSPFAVWVEELFDRGITAGCSVNPSLYCPNDSITRAQTAVFTVKTFKLPMSYQAN